MHTLARRNPSQTDTAAFRRWFGASKVVDGQGHPLMVYHGTTAGGFDAFRPNYRKGEQLGFGIHFAQARDFAAKYAEDPTVARKGETPKVYAVYLSIQRPLVSDAIVHEGTPEFALAKKLAGSKLLTQRNEDGVRMAYMQNAIDQTTAQRAEKLIREAGYDGIVYEAQLASPTGYGWAKTGSSRSFVVFDPTQVKSATDNAGTFDPADPSIYRNPRRRGLDVRPGIEGTYLTRYTAKGGGKRTYPAHGAAPWDRTLVRVADETTVASGRVYDTVKRAERAGRAALRGKRGAVEVLRVTNPARKNPFIKAPPNDINPYYLRHEGERRLAAWASVPATADDKYYLVSEKRGVVSRLNASENGLDMVVGFHPVETAGERGVPFSQRDADALVRQLQRRGGGWWDDEHGRFAGVTVTSLAALRAREVGEAHKQLALAEALFRAYPPNLLEHSEQEYRRWAEPLPDLYPSSREAVLERGSSSLRDAPVEGHHPGLTARSVKKASLRTFVNDAVSIVEGVENAMSSAVEGVQPIGKGSLTQNLASVRDVVRAFALAEFAPAALLNEFDAANPAYPLMYDDGRLHDPVYVSRDVAEAREVVVALGRTAEGRWKEHENVLRLLGKRDAADAMLALQRVRADAPERARTTFEDIPAVVEKAMKAFDTVKAHRFGVLRALIGMKRRESVLTAAEKVCTRCFGYGYIPGGVDDEVCFRCHGTGIDPKRPAKKETKANPAPDAAPLVFYHGAQRWEGPPSIVAHRKGHAEHGAGIYLTTSWTTANNYAKGGGSVYRFEVAPDVGWLEDARLPVAETVRWVKSLPRLKGKADIVATLERVAGRVGPSIPAETLIAAFVNFGASAGQHGPSLAEYLVAQGIDASHVSRSGEDWVVVFNPTKVLRVTRIPARDMGEGFAFDLPRVKRKNPAEPRYTLLGVDEEVTVCEHCGKADLKCTVVLGVLDADGNVEHEVRFGRSCAAKALRKPSTTTANKMESLAREAEYQRAWNMRVGPGVREQVAAGRIPIYVMSYPLEDGRTLLVSSQPISPPRGTWTRLGEGRLVGHPAKTNPRRGGRR